MQAEITQAGGQPLFEIAKTGYTPWVSQVSQNDEDIQTASSLQEGLCKKKNKIRFTLIYIYAFI